MTQPTYIRLNVTSTAYGGKGIARHDGKVYFVEDSIEGDTVDAEITQDAERYCNAVARAIVVPSPWRQNSPCPVSTICGGCQWQGVPYHQQLEWKRQFVSSSLERIGKLSDISVEILGSPEPQFYRNRVLLRARLYHDGRLTLGYFRRGSREFVSTDSCTIASSRLNSFMSKVVNTPYDDQLPSPEIRFRLELQDIPLAGDNSPHLLLSISDPDDQKYDVSQLVRFFAKFPEVAWAGSVKDLFKAPFTAFEEDLGITFHTAAGLFQQVNVPHNKTLRRLVYDIVDEIKPERILDVYCGSGNLSLPLAKQGYHIRGVEFSSRAIECAKHNCILNHLTNAEYFAGDTEKFLWRAAKASETYDLVIADPPREGMYKALVPLKLIRPQYLLYISCDPTTLARDLGSLCRKEYKLRRVLALDFFPNTYHVETVALLERNDAATHR